MTYCREMSFYQVCLKAVVRYLKAGTWNSCPVNPFSSLPRKVIDDVMETGRQDFRKISDFFLLLTSGSLTRLEMCRYNVELEHDLFREVIDKNGFKSLRYLSWHIGEPDTAALLKEALLYSCPKLEEFQSYQIFDFAVFKNCKELKVLKFHVSLWRAPELEETLSSLSSLRNLQVFDSFERYGDVRAPVLKHCPHLISLGVNDSLNTLKEIGEEAKKECKTGSTTIPAHFQLKMCLWGKGNELSRDIFFVDPFSHHYSFSQKVDTAVSLCPFVEKLIIYVSDRETLDSLKNLKHLTHLKIISLEYPSSTIMYEKKFLSLLQVIGKKLEHLTFNIEFNIHSCKIYDLCPNLKALELGDCVSFQGPLKPVCNVKLKRLYITTATDDALLFLLSSCKALEELCIENAFCLDDNLLIEILTLNPLKKLKICDINESRLSERGFCTLLASAVSLEEVCFTRRGLVLSRKLDMVRELNLTDVKHRRTVKQSYTVFD